MDIFVYSDESGVFDKVHNDYFVFGGLIFVGKEEKDIQARKYLNAEKTIRLSGKYGKRDELKASYISNKDKGKLYRSLNSCIKFGAVIHQNNVNNNIYAHKKSKQRYMDYVFKIALKRAMEQLIDKNIIGVENVENIRIFCDEHTTATDGRYELRESLEQEFKIGTFNFKCMKYYKPIFPNMGNIDLKFCDSKSVHLVRAADIVANRMYHHAVAGNLGETKQDNLYITYLP